MGGHVTWETGTGDIGGCVIVLLCDLFPPPLTEPSKLIFGQSWDFVPTGGWGGV